MSAERYLPEIVIPEEYNYIGVFLTLACNLHCSYCINRFGDQLSSRGQLSGDEWARGLNRLVSRADLPVSLQGGEPTLHPDFLAIVQAIRPDLHVDLLTNLELDLAGLMAAIDPLRLKRNAPYASIRVSYHPEVMQIEPLAAKVLTLLNAGYSVGIWGVLHPKWAENVGRAQDYCQGLGIDFRTKEFLGVYEGAMYGDFSYPEAINRRDRRRVDCRTTELLIGPGGDVFRCHADLYEGRDTIGHILDPEFTIATDFRECHNFGFCNPCDVKLKTNRHQEFGHTSVAIRHR